MQANYLGVLGRPEGPTPAPRPGPDPLTLVLRRGLIAVLCVVFALVLAAWQVAPRLDWARYRQAIAGLATTRLGRGVSIDGPIHLAFLPRPELTAQAVTLADRGDGVSARIGALRLSVAIGPLLRGELVPLSLKLDDPVVTIPWPMPGSMTTGVANRAAVARGFAAEVEGGTLHVGGVTLTGVDADIRADPDAGSFSATGTTTLQGAPSQRATAQGVGTTRFTTFFGAQGTDGGSTFSLTLDGVGRLAGAGAVFHGRRHADGTLEGRFRAEGPNASRLLPAPSLPWRIEGAVAAGSGQLRAPRLLLLLGSSPGEAAVTFAIIPSPRLDVTAAIGQVPLGSWVEHATEHTPSLPVHLDLSAAAASLFGGTLRRSHVALLIAPDRTTIESADSILPGGATARLAGAMTQGHGGASLIGKVHLHVPDARATLAWLKPVLSTALASDFAPPSDIVADLALTPGALSLTHVTVTLDGAALHGQAGMTTGQIPSLRVDLASDSLDATAWWPQVSAAFDRLGPAFRGPGVFRYPDVALNLNVARLTVPGYTLTDVALAARSDAHGLSLNRLVASLPGAHFEASARMGQDGVITDARLTFDAAEAAALPSSWRALPGLWHGPFHVAANAAGPFAKITLQARADLGDLRAELEGALNLPDRAVTGTATLRHPGAPRLLLAAGVADAGSWLEQGSVAVIAHFAATPGHVDVPDFSVAAATLQLTGKVSLDDAGDVPAFEASIDAPRLALPSFDPRSQVPLPTRLAAGWQGQLHLNAAEVFCNLIPVATHLQADVALAGGLLAANALNATIAGGSLHAEAALDTPSAVLSAEGWMHGASLQQLGAWPPWTWTDGTVDLSFGLLASGHSLDAFLATAGGTAEATLHGAVLQGADLARVTDLLTLRGARLRPALLGALSGGNSFPLSGTATIALDHGAVTAAAPLLEGGSGQVELAASLDLPARTEDATLRLAPRVAAPPTVSVRLVGPWQQPRRVVDIAAALAWAGTGKKR